MSLDAPPVRGAQQVAQVPLLAGVPEKIAKQHGAALAKAGQEVAELAQFPKRLEAWQQKAAERTLEQLYKTLAVMLAATPELERGKAAQVGLRAILAVIESTPSAALLPSLAALNGLADWGLRLSARKDLLLGDRPMSSLYGDAADAVQRLSARLAGRSGIGSALHVYPRLVEQLELGRGPLEVPWRRALADRVAEYLERAPPRTGFNLAIVAQLSADLDAERRAADPTLQATLRYQARVADVWAAAKAGLDNAADPEANAGPAKDRLSKALYKLLEANPAGPATLFEAIDHLRAAAQALPASAEGDKVLSALARVIVRLAESPAADRLLQYLSTQLGPIAGSPTALEMLELASKSRGGELARALVEVGASLRGLEPSKEMTAALGSLAELPPNLATTVAGALLPAMVEQAPTPGLIAAIVEAAQKGSDDPAAQLGLFARNFAKASQWHQQAQAADRDQVIAAMASLPFALDDQRASAILGVLTQIAQSCPKADLASLLGEDALGRAGVVALTHPGLPAGGNATRRLGELLGAVAGSMVGRRGDVQGDVARLAISISREMALVLAGQDLLWPRISADFAAAVAEPNKLTTPARVVDGVGARLRPTTAAAYADAHPELPLDLVFTAGLHLPPEDLAWVIDRAAASRGKDTVRMLRDTLFACVGGQRVDLIAALRTSASPDKAKSAVLREVAQSFRVGQQGQLDFAAMIAGLAKGADPIAEILAARANAAFAGQDLAALAEGKMTPQGLAEITAIAPNVADLLVQYQPGFRSMDAGIDMGKLGPVFREVLKSVLQGTWPTPKYEDEVGRRQLGILSPAQRAVWRSTTVTVLDQPAPAADVVAKTALALPLLDGLAKALAQHVALNVEGLPDLKFDQASLERLRADFEQTLAAVRNSAKGSPERSAPARRLLQVGDALSLLELQIGIGHAIAGAGGDGVAALRKAEPYLKAAEPGLELLESPGVSTVVADLLEMIPRRTSAGRKGRHAADEDSLTAMIASHKSGCLSFGDKRRRWGMAGSLSDANTKMLRVFDGDKQLYRTFMRLVTAKIGDYEGPAIYIESPVADGGGNQADLQLLYRGLYAKAEAMGIPALGGDGVVLPGWTQGPHTPLLTYDYGHTGLYHSDRTNQHMQQANGGKSWTYQANMPVMFPPTFKAQAK